MTLSSVRLRSRPIAGGSSHIWLPRTLRTVRLWRLKSSPGSVDRRFWPRKIFRFGSIRANTPSTTGGTRVNAARGRMVAFEREIKSRDLGLSILNAEKTCKTYESSMISVPSSRQRSMCFCASSSGEGGMFSGAFWDDLNGSFVVTEQFISMLSIASSITVSSLPIQTPLSNCLSKCRLGFFKSRSCESCLEESEAGCCSYHGPRNSLFRRNWV
jgi:hypothetical protein